MALVILPGSASCLLADSRPTKHKYWLVADLPLWKILVNWATEPLLGASMKRHGVAKTTVFSVPRYSTNLLNFVFVKTQSCLGPGQAWAPRQATNRVDQFVAVNLDARNSSKGGSWSTTPWGLQMRRTSCNQPALQERSNAATPPWSKIPTKKWCSCVVSAQFSYYKSETKWNEPANPRFRLSFFILAFSLSISLFFGGGVKAL